MYYTVYESHAKFLELIANSLSPRDVETAADRRAEGVTRALRVIAENVATLDGYILTQASICSETRELDAEAKAAKEVTS